MKRLIILFLFFGFESTQAQEVREVTSEIKEVTVYLKGAQVTRNFTTPLQKGKQKLVLVALPARLKESSIRVSTTGKGVKVLSVNSSLNYLKLQEKPEERGALQTRLKDEREKLTRANSVLQVFIEEEALIKQNKKIGGEQTGVNVADLKALAQYYNQRLTEIAMKKLELQKEIDQHNQRIQLLQSQLTALHDKPALPRRELTILVEATDPLTASFSVDYTVDEAGWIPSYDIRAEQLNKPIKITYKAGAYQNTGENWKNVKLTFSNADPSLSGQAPFLEPWFLGFNNSFRRNYQILNDRITGQIRDNKGKPLPGVNVIIQGTTVGTVTDINGNYELPLTSGASSLVFSYIGMQSQQIAIGGRNRIDLNLNEDVTQLSEVVVTGYGGRMKGMVQDKVAGIGAEEDNYEERINIAATPVVRQTTFEFRVDDPYTINSTGQHEVIDLVEYAIDSKFDYYSVPKLNKSAFLTAKLLDWESYNFLSGEASLFFEGKFIGKTVLDVESARDTLSLSLGTDKGVVVEREKVKNYNSRSFIGTTQKELMAFNISVKNNKSVPVEIKVEDQVPVSTNEDIKVEILKMSGAKYDPKTGKLNWNLSLKPGEHIKLELVYEVKFPKNKLLALE